MIAGVLKDMTDMYEGTSYIKGREHVAGYVTVCMYNMCVGLQVSCYVS